MQDKNRQTGVARIDGPQAAPSPQAIRFDWRWKTPPPSRPSMLRRMRRSIGGWIAYSVTFYRTAAK
jgi:hypothetical protein